MFKIHPQHLLTEHINECLLHDPFCFQQGPVHVTPDLASTPVVGYIPISQKPEAVVHAMKVRNIQ